MVGREADVLPPVVVTDETECSSGVDSRIFNANKNDSCNNMAVKWSAPTKEITINLHGSFVTTSIPQTQNKKQKCNFYS